MKKILFLFILLFQISFADYTKTWNDLLTNHTKIGTKYGIQSVLVDYKNISKDPQWNLLLEEIESVDPSNLSPKERKVFWINTYNIAAIKMVVDNYPLKSIKDAGNIFNPVWDKDIISIQGKVYSLGYIEHKILRKTGDERIHFAIVCASMSCPDLLQKAYTVDKLDSQLAEQENSFTKNKTKGTYFKNNKIYISKIFKWYKDDFKDINKTLDIDKNIKVSYINYNWKLNDY